MSPGPSDCFRSMGLGSVRAWSSLRTSRCELGQVVPAVSRLDGAEAELVDGRRLQPEVVIAATGFSRGLEPLVGHLGVLRDDGVPQVHGEHTHRNAPGLYFVGFDALCSGQLRLMARDAQAIARRVAYHRPSLPAFGRASVRLPGTPRTRPA